MAVTIPIPAEPNDFEERLQLEGEEYQVRIRWSPRVSGWQMDLADAEGAPIARGVAVRVGTPLTLHLTLDEPPGEFVCIDSQGRGEDPGIDDLGTRHSIVYLTAAEVAELQAGA